MLVALISINTVIKQSVNTDLNNASDVFFNALRLNQDRLLNTANDLISNPEFNQAIEVQDPNTIKHMLYLHKDRLNTDLIFLLDDSGTVIYSSEKRHLVRKKIINDKTLDEGRRDKDNFHFHIYNENIYQVVFIPIKTSGLSATLVVAIYINAETLRTMIPDSRVHITLIEGDVSTAEDQIIVSTIDVLENIISAIQAPNSIENIVPLPFYKAQQYLSRDIDLKTLDHSDIKIVISDDLSYAYQKYDLIRDRILIIAFLLIALSILGSLIFSRRLSYPLSALTKKVKKIAKGKYGDVARIPATTAEISRLVTAIERMKLDIAEREERIRYQATHDTLTGLLNRDAMIDAVVEEIRANKRVILMGINLVGFKTINDNLGTEIGDQCLVTVAQRLQRLAYHGICARYSADEFSVLLFIPDDVHTKDEKRYLCQRLLKELSAPMQLNGVSLSVEYRAGMIVYPDQATVPKDFLQRGKVALEHAITTSSPLYYYQDGQDKVHLKKIRILQNLKETIQNDDDQLQMYYQPKKNLRTGKVEKAEALIRWFHPEEGFIPPDTFIELAEQTGLIGLVTAWVIGRVLDDQAKMKEQGIHLQVSINLAAQDLSSDSLRVLIDQKITANNLSARDICLEVTERDMMTDVDKSLQLLNYYRERGFQLSIDDYGVGYSALSKLALMPVHELKIDKCFILKLAHKRDDQIIVRSTINMAHELGLSVIAEGVEDVDSQDFLRDLGCDYIQGYFLAKPMSLDALVHWLGDLSD